MVKSCKCYTYVTRLSVRRKRRSIKHSESVNSLICKGAFGLSQVATVAHPAGNGNFFVVFRKRLFSRTLNENRIQKFLV